VTADSMVATGWGCFGGTIYPFVLSKVQNPITRTVITIEPPVEVTSEDEFNTICELVHGLCRLAWDSRDSGPRPDPKVIGADWLKWSPPAAAEPEDRGGRSAGPAG